MAVTAEQVLAALKELKDPRPAGDVRAGYFNTPTARGRRVRVRVELPTPASPYKPHRRAVRATLSPRSSRAWRSLSTPTCGRAGEAAQPQRLVPSVKNVCWSDGEGRVGKSTVSANVAVALANLGCKVGLLDADIYGLDAADDGLRSAPTSNDGRKSPRSRHSREGDQHRFLRRSRPGVICATHAARRAGPTAAGRELGDLDYLILDLPRHRRHPVTIAQQVSVSGAVVVTTPRTWRWPTHQGEDMFDKVNIPVLGSSRT